MGVAEQGGAEAHDEVEVLATVHVGDATADGVLREQRPRLSTSIARRPVRRPVEPGIAGAGDTQQRLAAARDRGGDGLDLERLRRAATLAEEAQVLGDEVEA